MKKREAITYDDPKILTSALGYVWVQPPKPARPQANPFWTQPEDDTVEDLIESLTGYEWRVAFIREQITDLGIKPKGRTRAGLIRQLIEGFIDPNRFRQQLNTLSDEAQRFYSYLLLHTNLTGLRTTPPNVDQMARFSKSATTLTQQIVNAGLGLRGEDNNFFVPFKTFSLLPPRHITFATEPEPKRFEQAADPQMLLAQIQQLLNLIQNQQFKLRPRPQWKTPGYGYGSSYQVWPPVPDAAKRIRGGSASVRGRIDLCPPAPFPDDDTMDAWSTALGMPPDTVEFIYSLLVASDIVRAGSPVTVNEFLIQTWMLQTPGRQIVTLYQLYRNVRDWAAWWPQWRDGHISLGWNYQNWWLINSINSAIESAHYMLRWVILDVLAYLPQDAWLSVNNVAKLFGDFFPNPRTHYYLQHDLLLKGGRGWKGFLRAALLAILQGPLFDLGFVDLAPNRASPKQFRLHHLQDVHWGRVNDVPTGKEQPLTQEGVHFDADTLRLQITPPAPAEFLIAVQSWAEPRGLSNNKLLYKMDVKRLHNAFERGATPETLSDVWETTTTFSPPTAIREWWQTWWERYGHVRLYTGQSTVMTRDDFTMHELQVALPALRDSILGLVTPRTALVETEQVDKILAALERQGYMPKEMS